MPTLMLLPSTTLNLTLRCLIIIIISHTNIHTDIHTIIIILHTNMYTYRHTYIKDKSKYKEFSIVNYNNVHDKN